MKRILFVLALFALACSDTTEPCSDCGTRPARVEISAVTLLAPGSTPHPRTGAPVVDSIRVRYVIRNAGDSASIPQAVEVTASGERVVDSIPSLGGGDSIARVIVLPRTTELYAFEYNPNGVERVNVFVAGRYLTSPDSVHLRLPVLEVTLAPPSEPHLRANDPLRLSMTITNHSPLVAARNIQLRHCLWDYDVGCSSPNWTAFGTVPIADLAPGETRRIDYTTSITHTAMEEGYWHYGLQACVTPRSDTTAYRMLFTVATTWVCGSGGQIEVWPDYEACAPPTLSAQPVTLTSPNCGIYPHPPNVTDWELSNFRFKLYYVFALDAQAGQAYRVSGLESFEIRDNLGKRVTDIDWTIDRIMFPRAGRYYLTRYTWTGPFTVAAVPVP